jgi:hypothetical protein
MTIRDMALATIAAVIWGFGFIAIKFGLQSFSPPQLTALRFIIGCVALVFLPRPKISFPKMIAIGLTLYTGQFRFREKRTLSGHRKSVVRDPIETLDARIRPLEAEPFNRPGPMHGDWTIQVGMT